MRIVIDSYSWIEFFNGSSNGKKVKKILEDADELYTPDIVLAEIARKYHRDGAAEELVRNRLMLISANSRIITLDTQLALETAKCYSELLEAAKKKRLNTPSLADAILLATGRDLEAKLLTGDQHFQSLPETIWV